MIEWEPQDNFVISFSDETALDRTQEDFSLMLKKMRKVANEFGFDIQRYGSEKNMTKFYINYAKYIEDTEIVIEKDNEENI